MGGWFDAEDLAGPLRIYQTLRAESAATTSHLVMGPWTHGGWARGDGERLGNLDFGSKTRPATASTIEFPFFMQHLKDKALEPVAEATDVRDRHEPVAQVRGVAAADGRRPTMYLGRARHPVLARRPRRPKPSTST